LLRVRLDTVGRWRFTVRVVGLRGEGPVSFDVEVGEARVSAERIARGAIDLAVLGIVVGAWLYRRRRGLPAVEPAWS